jgi:hypothetical protein
VAFFVSVGTGVVLAVVMVVDGVAVVVVEGVELGTVPEEVRVGVPTAGSSAQAATAPSGASSRRWRRVSMDAL